MHEVIMPRIDVTMQSAKIVQWLKKVDESVSKGEALAVAEGEKTTFEIESQDSGVLRKIVREEGSDVAVGEIIALVGTPGEEVSNVYSIPHPTQTVTNQESLHEPSRTEDQLSQEIIASPAARALARKHCIDLTGVKGTGRNGRIQTADVQKAIENLPTSTEGTSTRIKETVTLTGIRKTVAERLSYSFHTTVPVLLTTEFDFEALEELRKKLTSSVTAFVVKAVATALREHLTLNSVLSKDIITIYDDINVSVAINIPDGLVAPMIEHTEKKSVPEISKRISELRDEALAGKLTLRDLTGGTFTVTNLGGEGVELFAPIINPPQAAILALGRAVRKPVVVGESICIRNRAILSLIFDHRITDGVPAARFLAHVKRLLENPESLLDMSPKESGTIR